MRKSKMKTAVARPRTRTMGLIKSHPLVYSGGGNPPVQPYSGSVAVGALSGFYQETRDIVTPGYKSLVKAGVWINNPYWSTAVTHTPYLANGYYRSAPNGGFEVLTGPVVSWIMGRLDLNLPTNTIDKTKINSLATITVWNRVEPAKSQSLVTAFEAHKTWATIEHRARKLAAIVVACRRGDLRALKSLMPGAIRKPIPTRVLVWDDDGKPLLSRRGRPKFVTKGTRVFRSPGNLDTASRLWLEYRYGWTPLVYDMIDTLKAVYAADLRNDLLPRDVLIARANGKDERTVTTSGTYVAGGLTYTCIREATFGYSVRTYIHYRWKAPDGIVRRLNDFGLFDVPRAIWELVPFSFIADWFCPIGDWLGALTPKIGVEILGMGHTMTDHVTARQWLDSVPAVNPPGAVPANRWPPACPVGSHDTMEQKTTERKTFLSTPFLPPIDVRLNIKRMADVAALFKSIR